MKKKIFMLLAFFISIIGYSQTFTDSNNITYTVIPSTTNVEITGYSGGSSVNIPTTAIFSSVTYNVTSIGTAAFFNKSLTNVFIPNSITNIGNVAFRVNQLTSINIPNSVLTIGAGAFVGNPSLANVVLGDNLTTIGQSAFGGCMIPNIIIPNSVTSIGASAFANNQLTTVTLGSGLTSIGNYAFNGNPLKTVISKSTTPPTITTGGTTDTFKTNRYSINLKIPAGTTGVYETNMGALWTGFSSVTEQGTETITFDDQSHTNNQSLGNPYSIVNNGETFMFTISGGVATNNIYRTTDIFCANANLSHLYAGNTAATTWTIETTSGNEIGLKKIRFDNLQTCFATTFNLSIEGFKNTISTGTQTFTVSSFNSIFNANTVFNDIDKIIITATNISNLGIDNINWEPAVPAAAVIPTVTTTAANTITNISVILAGNVTADGGTTVTERGLVYAITSVNSNPTIGGSGVLSTSNGSGLGTFSETISNLAAGTQYSFKAFAINGVGTSYGAVTTFTTTGKGWTGTTSTDWNISSNWSPNSLPISTDNLIIPNVANKPVINSGTSALANNISIDVFSSLAINSGGTLTMEGNLTQNGTFTINSDATSNGSLIVKGTQSGSSTVDYERYVSTSGVATQGWHLISSPVNSKNINDFYGDLVTNGTKRGIAPYVNTNTANLKWGYYTTADNPGFFTNGKGYTMKKTTAGIYNFNGALNTANSGISIEVKATGDNYNAIGNPYTSYINSGTFLDAVPVGVLTQKTIWLWDTSANGGVGEYATENSATAYKVAPGQGFFVESLSTADVNFSEAIQTHLGGNTFLKQESRPEIKLSITEGTNIKNTEIFYIKNKTTGFDDGYDSSMFNGFSNPFAIYTQLVSDNEGKDLAIQTLPNSGYENMVIPVGINAEVGKEITFSLNETNLPADLKVFLEDREADIFTRLDQANSTYKVTTSLALNGIGRFYLHTTTQSTLNINTDVALENISIYKADNSILKISGLPQGNTSFKLFTILGKQVMSTTFKSNGVSEISLPKLANGVYLVKLKTEIGKLNKKIIIE